METTVPDYFGSFHCIGGACPDSCCIGWEIDIDSDTLASYRTLSGDFGRRLNSSISEEGSFILQGERCPMLNGDNLCDIILNMGEDRLCTVCTEYPRYTESFEGACERGIGLSCPEAARIFFSEKRHFGEVVTVSEGAAPDPDYLLLKRIRRLLTDIIYDDKYTFSERLCRMLAAGCVIQDVIDVDYDSLEQLLDSFPLNELDISYDSEGFSRSEYMHGLFEEYGRCEMLNEEFPAVLDKTKDILSENYSGKIAAFDKYASDRIYEYENFIAYYLFRYITKAYYDSDVLSKVKAAAAAYLMIHEFDCARFAENGTFTVNDRIDTVRIYSKEIEHSQENLDLIYSLAYSSELFEAERLFAAIRE